jgi:hypothetical protein
VFENDKVDADWLMHLSCSVCNKTWAICTVCNKFKTKMTNNCMISIHRSTYHSKIKKRIKKGDININNSKKQKTNEIISNTTDAATAETNTLPSITNESNININLNEAIIIETNQITTAVKEAVSNESDPTSNNNNEVIYIDSDFDPSTQIEFDLTIGSIGDEHTVEIINDNNSNNDNNIITTNDVGINDDVTVTENIIGNNVNNTIVDKKIYTENNF